MNPRRPPRAPDEASNQAADQSTYVVFGQVAEQVERALAAGRAPDVDALVADHPELEEPIRDLVPALVALNELGQEPPEVGQSLESDEQRLGTLGDFRIVREIGRGGMGVVYEAEQIPLRRRAQGTPLRGGIGQAPATALQERSARRRIARSLGHCRHLFGRL